MSRYSFMFENAKTLTIFIGLLLSLTGTLFIAAFKGLILLDTAVLMIAIGLVLPYIVFSFFGNRNSQERSRKGILIYGLVAVVTQLILAQFFYDIFNFNQWLSFYGFFERGINGYSYCFSQKIFDMFPYPPSLLAFLAFGKTFSDFFGGGLFQFFFKLPFVVANIVGGYAVYRIVLFMQKDQRLAESMFCLYVFNPLLIMVTSVQGEFDPWATSLTILAAFFLVVKKNTPLSGLCLGLGVAIKVYPIFLLPFFLIYIKRVKETVLFAILSIIPVGLASAPFLILDYQAYLSIALNSGAKIGPFSLWNLFSPSVVLSPTITMIPTYVIIASLFLTRFRRHADDLVMNSLLCILALYVLNPITHENYGIWMLPFALTKFKEIKHLHFATLLPFLQMLIFTGMPQNGSGLFYWTYFITGKAISTTAAITNNGVFWSLANAFLVISFAVICSYIIIKYSYIATKK